MKPVFLCALALLLCWTGAAMAVSLRFTGEIVPFADNRVTLRTDAPGTVTLEADGAPLPVKPAVEGLRVEAGETTLVWDGLSWHGQPLDPGGLALRARFQPDVGQEETASIAVTVGKPLAAAVYCLTDAAEFAPGAPGLRIEAALAARGQLVIQVCPAGAEEQPVYTYQKKTSGVENVSLLWNGRDSKGKALPAGNYVVRAYGADVPERVHTVPVTLLAQPPEPLPLTLGNSLTPPDLEDDPTVWAFLCQPVTVVDGGEGGGAVIHQWASTSSKQVGVVSNATVALKVLDVESEEKWAYVGAYRQQDGEYVQGWMEKYKLKTILPSAVYGAVIDKRTQTMTIYEEGRRLGTLLVSTGLMERGNTRAETRGGVYLTASRQDAFNEGGTRYEFPIRIDGGNLMHSIGYTSAKGQVKNYRAQIQALGTKASHGCVRMDARALPEAGYLNAWWVWTHFGQRVKIVVIDDTETRQARLQELGVPLVKPAKNQP